MYREPIITPQQHINHAIDAFSKRLIMGKHPSSHSMSIKVSFVYPFKGVTEKKLIETIKTKIHVCKSIINSLHENLAQTLTRFARQ